MRRLRHHGGDLAVFCTGKQADTSNVRVTDQTEDPETNEATHEFSH